MSEISAEQKRVLINAIEHICLMFKSGTTLKNVIDYISTLDCAEHKKLEIAIVIGAAIEEKEEEEN